MNKKFYKMWNLDRYFRNLVGLNIFDKDQIDKLFRKYNDYFYNLQKDFLKSINNFMQK